LLAGRSWKTAHLDWRRRIAHVEPSDQRGKSRWLGEGQFLSYEVCQSIREILATDLSDLSEPQWSQRSTSRLSALREDFPWVRSGSTALVNHADSELRWWTFAGGVANTILSNMLKQLGDVEVDNVSIRIEGNAPVDHVREHLGSLRPAEVAPVPDPRAIENLKFSEALPGALADEVFCSRFDDPSAIKKLLAEPVHLVAEPR